MEVIVVSYLGDITAIEMTRECGALIGVARQGRGWKKEFWGRGSFVEFWGPWPCH